MSQDDTRQASGGTQDGAPVEGGFPTTADPCNHAPSSTVSSSVSDPPSLRIPCLHCYIRTDLHMTQMKKYSGVPLFSLSYTATLPSHSQTPPLPPKKVD